MKVCFLTSNHEPEARGGTEQVTAALEAEFRRRGVETVVITSSTVPHSGVDVRREEHEGVTVHRVFKRPGEWDHQGFVRPRLLGIVRELLELERPDVLHVHSTAALGTGCAAIARDLGVPVVMTFHDLWTTCARYFRLPAPGITCPSGTDRAPCVACVQQELRTDAAEVARALAERDRRIRADVALADACTAPSDFAARSVRECLPCTDPIEVIPHGLVRAVAAADRSAAPRPGEPLRVGSFGGIVAAKGAIELLDALVDLPCEVHLAGRLCESAVVERCERLARGGQVVVHRGGYGANDRHPARDLHLAVFPSKCQETYGLVVDEALAHGVPCVVSDHGALAERRGQPGVVVTPIAELRSTLRELITSRHHLADLRAAVPAQLTTIAAAAERYLEIYRRSRGDRPTPGSSGVAPVAPPRAARTNQTPSARAEIHAPRPNELGA